MTIDVATHKKILRLFSIHVLEFCMDIVMQ
uniref:Uncharacterized protein n=1 Tax=Arundo donax TaxID=35708 RepID=A0A0A9FN54_ARUDO